MTDKLKLEGVLSQGYGIIPKMVMKDKELSIEAKSIYSYLCSYAGGGDTAFPSVELICHDLGISENRLLKHRKQLIDRGYIYIKRERKEKGWSNNIYTIAHTVHLQNVGIRNEGIQNKGIGNVGIQNEGTNKNSLNNNNLNKNNNNKSRNSANAKYADDSPYMQLAFSLQNHIKERNPEQSNPNWQKWADDFRKTVEIDKKSIENVKKVLDWSQQDSFWRNNVLSPAKFRKQYDQLKLKMDQNNGVRSGGYDTSEYDNLF